MIRLTGEAQDPRRRVLHYPAGGDPGQALATAVRPVYPPDASMGVPVGTGSQDEAAAGP